MSALPPGNVGSLAHAEGAEALPITGRSAIRLRAPSYASCITSRNVRAKSATR